MSENWRAKTRMSASLKKQWPQRWGKRRGRTGCIVGVVRYDEPMQIEGDRSLLTDGSLAAAIRATLLATGRTTDALPRLRRLMHRTPGRGF